MKKSLAILLTLILTFSCVSLLGTGVAVAEEIQEVGVNLIESDFHKPMYSESDKQNTSMWQFQNAVEYLDDNNDGTTDFARLSSTGAKANLYSYTAVVNPGNTYQISFDMRIPESVKLDLSTFVSGGTTYQIFPQFVLYQPGNTAAGQRVSDIYRAGTNDYAYKNKRRDGFSATWTIGDYTSTRSNYSDFGDMIKSQYYSMCKDADGNVISPNVLLKDWTKVTMTFKAIEDDANQGPQVVAFNAAMGSGATGVVIDFKDFTFKCTDNLAVTNTIMKSNFSEEAANVNKFPTKHPEFVEFLDSDDEDEVADYAELTGSGKVGEDNIGAAITTAPFNVVPGNKYKVSFEMRIPEDSASYYYQQGESFYALTPLFALFQHTKGDRHQTGINDYAYKNVRRDAYKSTITFANGTTTVKNSQDGYSLFDMKSFNKFYSSTTKAEDVFGEWTTVTIEFTGLASDDNAGAQATALCINLQQNIPGLKLQVKNIQVDETKSKFDPLPEITDDIIYFNSFEDVDDAKNAGVVVYNYHNNEICDWATNSFKVKKYDGTTGKNALSVRANNQYIFIPVDKALLVPGRSYNFSLDWKLPKNADGDRVLSEITFIGYDHDFTVAEGETLTFDGSRKQLAGRVNDKKTLTVTGDWTSFNKYNDVTISQEQYETYEEFGICVSFPTASSGTNEDNTIYLDNIMVKTNPTKGDADGDYDVDLEDVTIMARALAGWGLNDIKVDVKHLDVNADKKHNLKDLILIAQKAAGWEVELV